MATKSKAADEPQPDEPVDPAVQAEERAKVQEQGDKDRDEVAQAAVDDPLPTPVPANFEDAAAHARIADAQQAEQAKQAQDETAAQAQSQPAADGTKPDGEASS